ncbi:MAG: helix-turn-helix domain-containing protein [Syntrophales bacterium]|jgi:DNA-binding protein Fis
MRPKKSIRTTIRKPSPAAPSAVEEIIQQRLEDIATLLCSSGNGKSRLHKEVMMTVEKGLFKIALRRSNHIKSTAAIYLGINRNTFQKKMTKLGLDGQS